MAQFCFTKFCYMEYHVMHLSDKLTCIKKRKHMANQAQPQHKASRHTVENTTKPKILKLLF